MLTRNDGTTDVEFPEGGVHTFETTTGLLSSIGDLTRTISVPGRTRNTVNVTYLGTIAGTPCVNGESFAWRITDSESARSNYICFKSGSTPESIYPGIVSRIVIAAPPTSAGTPRAATYVFSHTNMTVTRGCHSHVSWSSDIANVPMLTGLTLPDGSAYVFTYNSGDTGIGTCDRGVLQSMKLPTGATYAYAYRYFLVPNDECSRLTFNSRIVGVHTKSVTHPKLPSATWTYTSSLTPTPGTVNCETEGGPVATSPPAEEMIVTVTDPLGNVTEHYYSVWPGAPDLSSPNGFIVQEYGQPFSRLRTSAFSTSGSTTAFLSTRVYTAGGYAASPKVPLRSTYLTAERDVMACFGVSHTCTNANSRLNREQTVYHDDGDRKAETYRSRFDGVGHYRKSTLGGTFSGVNSSDTVMAINIRDANVNSSSGLNLPDSAPGGAVTLPPVTTPWILNMSSSTTTTQGSSSFVTQSCHDPLTGLVRATRIVSADTLYGQSRDVVAVYRHDANGNLISESYFGADVKNNAPANTSLCAIADLATLPPSDVHIEHAYQYGTRKTSQYVGASFLHLNRTVDPATGMTLSTIDSGGKVTTYTYHGHFGIASIQPPDVVATTFDYYNSYGTTASTFVPARVVAQSVSATLGIRQSEHQYDGLGRLWRSKIFMPNGTWSVRETLFDAAGHVSSRSEPAELPASNEFAFSPAWKTTWNGYDPFGRPASVTTADGSVTTFTYYGVSRQSRTTSIASSSGPPPAIGDIPTSVTETYDRQGRLIQVSAGERYGQASSVTAYEYDAADHLVKVSMPSLAGMQQRFFNYDYRGMLVSEQHPEVGLFGDGLVEYFDYDARGHAHRKKTGDAEIRLTFDAVERITAVDDVGVIPSRPLKQFAYCGSGSCNGKLAASARFNYVPDLGIVAVTESYQYTGRGGRHSRRDRAVGTSIVNGQELFAGQEFVSTQTFDEFGDLASLGYPCRSANTVCLPTDRQRTVSFTRSNGMLTAVPGYASAITYQPNGLIDTVTHGQGSSAVLEQWISDNWSMSRPQRIRAMSASGAELWTTGNYVYDGSGNIQQLGTDRYAYDAVGRLAQKTNTSGSTGFSTVERGYDEYGNFLYIANRGCGDNGKCFDTGTTPMVVAGTTNRYLDFVYDSRGNVTSDAQRSYTYDVLNVTTGMSMGGREFRYIYTADDERIAAVERKNMAGTWRNVTTWTARDFDNRLLSIWTDDSTTGTRYIDWKEDEIWRDTSLLANVSPLGTRHYTLDHLGSPRFVTNSNGQPVGTQDFDPFGSGGTTDGGALQFTGHERDAANLAGGTLDMPDYMHARYYEAGMGRFLSVDPAGGRSNTPQSWNRYSYTRNNPLRLVDPDGREPLDPAIRAFLEVFFGRDLSRVRVYGGAFARGIARVAGADAITIGNRIFFAAQPWRSYKSKTSEGVALAGHEVGHTIQYTDLGGILPFLSRYLGEYFANRRAGMGREEAYAAVSFEADAYLAQEEIEELFANHQDLLDAIQRGVTFTPDQMDVIRAELGWMPRDGRRQYIDDTNDPFRGTGFCDASNVCH
ncbi:MAG TPA: DUF4157 domain-containing protein [Thermoanaerobaculia bacterium]|nr:DUF4157 domain-containing protein [Thermoanaerobaculia bacterium]